MSLISKAVTGKGEPLVKLMVYGVGGIGKSTFAASSPAPFFLDFDKRIDRIGPTRYSPISWEETTAVIKELFSTKHDYKTVVIDTLDALEPLIHKYVCDKHGKASIEDFEYSKGYVYAYAEWKRLAIGLDKLQGAGLNFILLAHDTLRTKVEPGADGYECRGLALRGTQKFKPDELLSHPMDLVGYAHFDDIVTVDKRSKRTRMVAGDRLLSFAHNPAYFSKKGIDFPDEIPLSWEEFEKALKETK